MIKILKYGSIPDSEIFDRAGEQTVNDKIRETVSDIITNVKENGDSALLEYCRRFDKAELTSLEVSREESDAAYASVSPELIAVMEEAAANIRDFHSHQIRNSFILNTKPGIVTGQKIIPIERVGLYVPGGTASYPSSVLMNAIPAKLAGCAEIVITTPPTGGSINPVILAAARIAGVDRIFKCGGAQAIAALAYGTTTIPRVDKIVGPGNAYVAEAKRQVFGRVAIDMIAGPSEILVIADGTCNPGVVAADMLSQAEHDRMASAVLVTTSEKLAGQVSEELECRIPLLPRSDIARDSIDTNGKIIITDSIATAVSVTNKLAPEHLELCCDNPFDYLDMIKNAGSVFLGKNCPEALGDYMAGPNHTLPTSGTARFSSPLSVDDFIKKTQYTYFTSDALATLADKIAVFARSEGLEAHALSALVRKEESNK